MQTMTMTMYRATNERLKGIIEKIWWIDTRKETSHRLSIYDTRPTKNYRFLT